MTKELTMEKTRLLESWETKPLGEICEMIKRGSQPKYTESADGEIVLNQKCIRDHKINLSVVRKHDTSKKTINKERYIQLGDGLINSTGTGTLGRVAQVRELNFSAFVDTHITIVRPNKNLFFLDFFGWMLIHIEKEIEGLGEGASGQTELSRKIIERINVSFPSSKDQQKQIVAILDKAFAAIDTAKANAEQNLQNAKALFESYLQNVFSTKGDDWEEKQIKNLTELVTKGSSPKWQGVNYVDEGGIFFLTSKNVGEGELLLNNKKYLEEKFNEIQKTSILKKGDVLTNIVGASIGRTAIFNLNEITNINQAVCLMRCNSEKVYNYYLMYLLNSPFFKNILHDNEVDNARANLSLTFFKNLAIPLPKLSEQKEIVKNIKSFSTETKKLEVIYKQKIADLEEMKKSVLQKAFSGQLNTIN